jgi:hypothetical protein
MELRTTLDQELQTRRSAAGSSKSVGLLQVVRVRLAMKLSGKRVQS